MLDEVKGPIPGHQFFSESFVQLEAGRRHVAGLSHGHYPNVASFEILPYSNDRFIRNTIVL